MGQAKQTLKRIGEVMATIREAKAKLSIKDLIDGREKLGTGQGPDRVVKILQVTPNVRAKQLNFRGEAAGSVDKKTKKRNIYRLIISFTAVDFATEQDKEHPFEVEVIRPRGQVFVGPQSMTEDKVQVRCECLDFQHRYSWQDQGKGGLFGGNPIPYTRKTTTRPKVNPKNFVGLCKHLKEMNRRLEGLGVVKK